MCLVVLIGCGTFQKQEPGVFQPNNLQKVNSFTSKMVTRAEQTKLSSGIPLPKQTNSVKSFAIAPPTNAVSGSTMDVPRGLTIIPDSKLPNEPEPQIDASESFLHRLLRYSIIWVLFLGFGYSVYKGFKKYKTPKDNPFKKTDQPTQPKPPEQLNLNL